MVKADLRLMNVALKSKVLMNVYCIIPKLYDSLNIVVIMQKK